MIDPRHDYSRHAFHELEQESSNLDPAAHPNRAKALQAELLRRLDQASVAAAVVAAKGALSVGAQYAQLDRVAARRFLWPFLGFSFLFSFVAGFVVGFIASFIGGILVSFGVVEAGTLADRAIRFAITLPLAVPVAIMWLKIFTRRPFGGYALRIVAAGARDAAEQPHAAIGSR